MSAQPPSTLAVPRVPGRKRGRECGRRSADDGATAAGWTGEGAVEREAAGIREAIWSEERRPYQREVEGARVRLHAEGVLRRLQVGIVPTDEEGVEVLREKVVDEDEV